MSASPPPHTHKWVGGEPTSEAHGRRDREATKWVDGGTAAAWPTGPSPLFPYAPKDSGLGRLVKKPVSDPTPPLTHIDAQQDLKVSVGVGGHGDKTVQTRSEDI